MHIGTIRLEISEKMGMFNYSRTSHAGGNVLSMLFMDTGSGAHEKSLHVVGRHKFQFNLTFINSEFNSYMWLIAMMMDSI